jgi:F0F1-type ATP synthase assembly protein I
MISSALCGIWLDRQLQSAPFIMMILMVLGFAFGMYAVYRIAMRMQEEFKQRSKKIE